MEDDEFPSAGYNKQYRGRVNTVRSAWAREGKKSETEQRKPWKRLRRQQGYCLSESHSNAVRRDVILESACKKNVAAIMCTV